VTVLDARSAVSVINAVTVNASLANPDRVDVTVYYAPAVVSARNAVLATAKTAMTPTASVKSARTVINAVFARFVDVSRALMTIVPVGFATGAINVQYVANVNAVAIVIIRYASAMTHVIVLNHVMKTATVTTIVTV